jgi:hypothetical protein
MKEKVKNVLIQKRIAIITLFIFGIFLNIFFTWFSSPMIMLSLTILLILSFWFYHWPAEPPIMGGFTLLAFSIFLSPIINNDIIIDLLSTWAYILTGIGVVDRLFEKEEQA